MAILPILSVPDSHLRRISDPVQAVTDDVRRLMDDMLETMHYKDRGVGLAANQVGVLKRVIVCAFENDKDRYTVQMANPEIISTSCETFILTEGCLSIPQGWADVERPRSVKVRYLDYNNTLQEQDLSNEMSSIVQHEIDHLNGVLFIDHLGSTKKRLLLERAIKTRQNSKV